ncbi:nitroreductase [Nocardia abscessus]|uniref:nitroreductase n=1 Tax=Nocardia abscessus TaxID=120957 RepID=UPI002458EF8B|nr:nitroreductase [Nocardia abscessus]
MIETSPTDLTGALEQLLSERWSCRAYLPEPVPHDQITRVLQLAQRAASWCNTQPWQVIVTEGAGTERFRAALSVHAAREGGRLKPDIPMPDKYTGVHLERRRESGWQLYQAVGITRGDREASARQAFKNFELFGAPHCAIITVDASQGAYGALDTGLFVANFLLAAQSLGLGAIPQAALATYAPFVREFFDIPADRAVLLGISFGRPDRDHPANGYRTRRADLEQVVQWCTA